MLTNYTVPTLHILPAGYDCYATAPYWAVGERLQGAVRVIQRPPGASLSRASLEESPTGCAHSGRRPCVIMVLRRFFQDGGPGGRIGKGAVDSL